MNAPIVAAGTKAGVHPPKKLNPKGISPSKITPRLAMAEIKPINKWAVTAVHNSFTV